VHGVYLDAGFKHGGSFSFIVAIDNGYKKVTVLQ